MSTTRSVVLRSIVLIGLMGSGKSAVGQLLAQQLGLPFVDTDLRIAEQAGRSIAAIFAAEGEAGFRRREAAVIAGVAAQGHQVIATGGGAVLDPQSRGLLKASGSLFWLDAPAAVLLQRATGDGLTQRPLLTGPDPLARLQALAQERAPIYAEIADYIIQTDGRAPAEVAAAILAILESERGASPDGTAPG